MSTFKCTFRFPQTEIGFDLQQFTWVLFLVFLSIFVPFSWPETHVRKGGFRRIPPPKIEIRKSTLTETNIAHLKNGWLEDLTIVSSFSFPFGGRKPSSLPGANCYSPETLKWLAGKSAMNESMYGSYWKMEDVSNVMLVFRGCLVSGTSPDLVISQNFKKPKVQPMFLAPLAPLLKEMSLPDRPVSFQHPKLMGFLVKNPWDPMMETRTDIEVETGPGENSPWWNPQLSEMAILCLRCIYLLPLPDSDVKCQVPIPNRAGNFFPSVPGNLIPSLDPPGRHFHPLPVSVAVPPTRTSSRSEVTAASQGKQKSHQLMPSWVTTPWNQQQSHLKMVGWKMNFLFGMAQFQGRTVSFRGVGVFLNHFFLRSGFWIDLHQFKDDESRFTSDSWSFYFFGRGEEWLPVPSHKIPQNGKHDQERWSVNWCYSCMVDALAKGKIRDRVTHRSSKEHIFPDLPTTKWSILIHFLAAYRQGYRVNQPFIWEMVQWAQPHVQLRFGDVFLISSNLYMEYPQMLNDEINFGRIIQVHIYFNHPSCSSLQVFKLPYFLPIDSPGKPPSTGLFRPGDSFFTRTPELTNSQYLKPPQLIYHIHLIETIQTLIVEVPYHLQNGGKPPLWQQQLLFFWTKTVLTKGTQSRSSLAHRFEHCNRCRHHYLNQNRLVNLI